MQLEKESSRERGREHNADKSRPRIGRKTSSRSGVYRRTVTDNEPWHGRLVINKKVFVPFIGCLRRLLGHLQQYSKPRRPRESFVAGRRVDLRTSFTEATYGRGHRDDRDGGSGGGGGGDGDTGGGGGGGGSGNGNGNGDNDNDDNDRHGLYRWNFRNHAA